MRRKCCVLLLVLSLLMGSVLAVGSEDFNAKLTIEEKEAAIEVTVEDSQVLHDKQPALTIPCAGKDWANAVVFDPEGKELTGVTWDATTKSVTFPVVKGGTYIIKEAEAENIIVPIKPERPEEKPVVQFTDVSPEQWYYAAVRYVCEQGIMSGVSATHFAPERTLTRAMVVQILYNMAGKPAVGAEAFTDVMPSDWYCNAVAWAAEQNVVNGVGDGKFAPEAPVTREQLAAILWRHAKTQGKDVSQTDDLTAFADAETVSAYAADAMQWAVGAGLINGMDGRLVPQGHATRAQAAAIFMRYCEQ